MTIQELFVRSNKELKKVIDQISAGQWDIDVPAGITMKPATLHQTINYHAYDDAWVTDVLDGKTKEEVGNKYEAILTTEKSDTLGVYDNYNSLAIDKLRDFQDLEK